jgi:hypothetical protein
MVGLEEEGDLIVPLFFYFPFYHGLPSGKPFPPTSLPLYTNAGK